MKGWDLNMDLDLSFGKVIWTIAYLYMYIYIWLYMYISISKSKSISRNLYKSIKIYIYICVYIYLYTGWWLTYTPLKNIKVSWGDVIPNIWKVIKTMFQTTNQEHNSDTAYWKHNVSCFFTKTRAAWTQKTWVNLQQPQWPEKYRNMINFHDTLWQFDISIEHQHCEEVQIISNNHK